MFYTTKITKKNLFLNEEAGDDSEINNQLSTMIPPRKFDDFTKAKYIAKIILNLSLTDTDLKAAVSSFNTFNSIISIIEYVNNKCDNFLQEKLRIIDIDKFFNQNSTKNENYKAIIYYLKKSLGIKKNNYILRCSILVPLFKYFFKYIFRS